MSVKLLTEHRLEFERLKGGCTGSSKSTLVKMPHSWKSYVVAQFYDTNWLRADVRIQYAGYINISKKMANSDKYHKSRFSCMQCAVSCSSSLKLSFFHANGDTAGHSCFVC